MEVVCPRCETGWLAKMLDPTHRLLCWGCFTKGIRTALGTRSRSELGPAIPPQEAPILGHL